MPILIFIGAIIGWEIGGALFDHQFNAITPERAVLVDGEINRLSEEKVKQLLHQCAIAWDKPCHKFILH